MSILINRKEEIKKKGFSIALESDTRATQSPFENVDFSKIKVGAKTLDDAIYTLGDLKRIDKTLADKKEVLRAMHTCDYEKLREISNFFYKTSGIPISEHQEMTKQKESRYNAVMFMINHDREVLYERINRRVDIMVNDGLYDEVKKLMGMGYTPDLNSMQGIGYKELISHFNAEITLDEAIEQIKQNSRRYAKRQLTWFRRNENINLLSPDNATQQALKIIDEKING